MPLLGQGVLIIWHGVTAEGRLDMLHWHNAEHIPERLSVPGFRRGRRYDRSDRGLEYLDLYETASVETIRSAPYLERLNHPTPWTSRVLPHFRDTVRLGCRVAASAGRGQGGTLVTARIRPGGADASALRRWLDGEGLASLLRPAGVVGVHLLETVPETTRIRTAEGRLKGGEGTAAEEPWPLVLLAECSDAGTAEALVAGPLAPAALATRGAGRDAVVVTHRLQVTMDAPAS
jgi:hypothetical protein